MAKRGRPRKWPDDATRKREWERRHPRGVCIDCGTDINFKSTRCLRCATGAQPRENGRFVTKS